MFLFLNKKIKRVCLLGNQHGLLQYLMLSSLEEIEQTFFLWNFVGIPDSIRKQFGKRGVVISSHNKNSERFIKKMRNKSSMFHILSKSFQLFYFYRIYYPLKLPFLLNRKLEYWGHDHVQNAYCILRNHPFVLLEDGTLNYHPYPYRQTRQRFLFIKRLLAGKNYCEHLRYAGDESNCVKIYLTGLSDKGDVLKNPKVVIKSFVEMWNECDLKKRSFINRIFDFSQSLINECANYKHILLTTPFSELELITEKEKIDMYKNIIKLIGRSDILIKPHPRENTDYSKHLPNVYVLKTKTPMQLLSLNNIKFDCVYSVNASTALFDFPYKIKVCIFGTNIYSPLYEKTQNWNDNIDNEISNKNIELIQL